MHPNQQKIRPLSSTTLSTLLTAFPPCVYFLEPAALTPRVLQVKANREEVQAAYDRWKVRLILASRMEYNASDVKALYAQYIMSLDLPPAYPSFSHHLTCAAPSCPASPPEQSGRFSNGIIMHALHALARKRIVPYVSPDSCILWH